MVKYKGALVAVVVAILLAGALVLVPKKLQHVEAYELLAQRNYLAIAKEMNSCTWIGGWNYHLRTFAEKGHEIFSGRTGQQLHEDMKALWPLQLQAHQKLQQGQYDSCFNQGQSLVVSFRRLIDSLLIYQHQLYLGQESISWRNGDLLKSSAYQRPEVIHELSVPELSAQVQSGDLFLGFDNLVSGIISNLGPHGSPFGHAFMAYEDEKGELYQLETNIYADASARPFEFGQLKSQYARILHLRFKQPEQGQRTAQWLFREIERLGKLGKVIPFDRFSDPRNEEYSCAEFFWYGHHQAWPQEPRFPRRLTLGRPGVNLIWNMALRNQFPKEFIIPTDLEWDERVSVVAEYRNLNNLNEANLIDLAMKSLYERGENIFVRGIFEGLKKIFSDFDHPAYDSMIAKNLAFEAVNASIFHHFESSSKGYKTFFELEKSFLHNPLPIDEIAKRVEDYSFSFRHNILRQREALKKGKETL